MSAPRLLSRVLRPLPTTSTPFSALNRSFGSTALRFKDSNERAHPNVSDHRDIQTNKPPNQAVPNTTSTMTKDYPKVGEKTAPPEMLNSVNPNYRPADPYPGKVEHFTGGRQESGAQKPELGVGEMEGITFKVEPLKRAGEDTATMRARLLCMLLLGFVGHCRNVMSCFFIGRANEMIIQIRAASVGSSSPTSSFPPLLMSTWRR